MSVSPSYIDVENERKSLGIGIENIILYPILYPIIYTFPKLSPRLFGPPVYQILGKYPAIYPLVYQAPKSNHILQCKCEFWKEVRQGRLRVNIEYNHSPSQSGHATYCLLNMGTHRPFTLHANTAAQLLLTVLFPHHNARHQAAEKEYPTTHTIQHFMVNSIQSAAWFHYCWGMEFQFARIL